MNTHTVRGNWNELKGKIKQKWSKLTDDDLTYVEGKTEELGGVLEKRYGMAKDEADRACKDFYNSCNC